MSHVKKQDGFHKCHNWAKMLRVLSLSAKSILRPVLTSGHGWNSNRKIWQKHSPILSFTHPSGSRPLFLLSRRPPLFKPVQRPKKKLFGEWMRVFIHQRVGVRQISQKRKDWIFPKESWFNRFPFRFKQRFERFDREAGTVFSDYPVPFWQISRW